MQVDAFPNRDAVTFDRVGDDAFRFAVAIKVVHQFQRVNQFFHTVAVDFADIPAERFKFIGQRFDGHNHLNRAVQLEFVIVNDTNQIIQFVFGGKHHRFPILPFIQFAVTDDTKNAVGRVVFQYQFRIICRGYLHSRGIDGSVDFLRLGHSGSEG